MQPRLTIILPLKGRETFTLRFLWHANECQMPYRFLIADGQVTPKLGALMSNAAQVFPNLDLEYVEYPDDVGFPQFFRKMSDAINHVRTPYVMLADNDDFLLSAGIERSLDFLDQAPDYVSCGGGIAGFSVYAPTGTANPGLVGPFNKFTFRYAAEDRSLDLNQGRLTDRLVAGAQYSWGYYAVYRAPILAQIWREVIEIDFSDLMLFEWYCGLRTLTLGKARSDPSTIAYLRQYWTSMRSTFSEDWVHHLLRSRFTIDFTSLIKRLSSVVSQADQADEADVAEKLRQTFDSWYRGFIRNNYGPSGIVRKYLRENFPSLLQWMKTRRRFGVQAERQKLLKMLKSHGASDAYLADFKREVEAIDDTLNGNRFAAFFAAHDVAVR